MHALSRHQICHLLLDDIDPAASTLQVAARRRPLDELTADTLLAWVTRCVDRFPQTASPYLFVNRFTAFGLGPINPSVITSLFSGLPTTTRALRDDRLLAEPPPAAVTRSISSGSSASAPAPQCATWPLPTSKVTNLHAVDALTHDRGACSHRLAGQKA